MLTWIILAMIAALVIWVRVAPSNAQDWHADPETVQKGARPKQFLMRNGTDEGADADCLEFNIPAQELANKFNDIALAQPNTVILAGSVSDLWVTYMQRTKLMRYPDYISVKVTRIGDERARLSIYSRSRFGRSDLGVNKARIKRWTAALRDISSGG